MGTIATIIAGLALAGATTFGVVSAQSDLPSGDAGHAAPVYDQGQ